MQNLSKSAGFCQEICLSSNKTTFAIKDKICRCLKDRPRENETSPTLCNAFCYKPEDRGEKPYFEECGGKEFYSVYISATKDEGKPMVDGVYCVAIQCSEKTNTFLFDRYCSSSKHPVCKLTDRILNASDWSQSMNICKSEPLSSYLTGEVFLDDINKTCKMIGKELPEGSWVGVANEVYTGIDRGKLKIIKTRYKKYTYVDVC
ncbi:uncharacterized protein LOC134231437 [Saccostrea cucullata]|uniref:uncharacterized protein LOC134231437 n=1 Tax=Saccostrea cuccullata TaxID=36930 RepID=UPI002ED1B7B7